MLEAKTGQRVLSRGLLAVAFLAGACTATEHPPVASLDGSVTGRDDRPVQGARVLLDPYGLEAVSDRQGRFTFHAVPVSGNCVLVTLTVRAKGYGVWQVLDDPFYAGQEHSLDVSLIDEVQIERLGPPRADPRACRRVGPEPSPVRAFTVLIHLGYSFDDASEHCLTFEGDGKDGDPNGIAGKEILSRVYGTGLGTQNLPDGREVACAFGDLGPKGCTFKEGRWVHLYRSARGSAIEVPNDISAYRLHDGETDAWLWQERGQTPYGDIGISFVEACEGRD